MGLSSLIFLTFALFAIMVVFQEPLSHLTRAKEEFEASPSTSLILAWPLNVKADNKTASNLTVFVRTAKGRLLSNKVVAVTSTLGQVQTIESTSDKEGKTMFRIISDTPGTAEIEAIIDNNIKLTKKVTVRFDAVNTIDTPTFITPTEAKAPELSPTPAQ